MNTPEYYDYTLIVRVATEIEGTADVRREKKQNEQINLRRTRDIPVSRKSKSNQLKPYALVRSLEQLKCSTGKTNNWKLVTKYP